MRICSCCKKRMVEGYLFDDGTLYACSDKCLDKLFTEKEKKECFKLETLFYTEWEIECEYCESYEDCKIKDEFKCDIGDEVMRRLKKGDKMNLEIVEYSENPQVTCENTCPFHDQCEDSDTLSTACSTMIGHKNIFKEIKEEE